MQLDKEKATQFLAEYRELCVKYGMSIDACGCCNSPFLVALARPEDVGPCIAHLAEAIREPKPTRTTWA